MVILEGYSQVRMLNAAGAESNAIMARLMTDQVRNELPAGAYPQNFLKKGVDFV